MGRRHQMRQLLQSSTRLLEPRDMAQVNFTQPQQLFQASSFLMNCQQIKNYINKGGKMLIPSQLPRTLAAERVWGLFLTLAQHTCFSLVLKSSTEEHTKLFIF